jgi:multicomponent Na+:H+ antiporter subunit G
VTELLASVLLLAGATFMLLASVGVLRMPDLYTRMQATTKATTLGVGCLALAVAVGGGGAGAWVRAAAMIVFLYLTAPVAAHVIARAAYFVGTGRWKGTILDEMQGRYDPKTHELGGPGAGQ